MLGGFSLALFLKPLGIFQAQLGGFPRFLMIRNDAVSRRQLELLVRGAGQAFVLVKVKSFHFFSGPVCGFQKLDAGSDARLVFKALDIQVRIQYLETIVVNQLSHHLLEAQAMQGVVLVIDVFRHALRLLTSEKTHIILCIGREGFNIPLAPFISRPALPVLD